MPAEFEFLLSSKFSYLLNDMREQFLKCTIKTMVDGGALKKLWLPPEYALFHQLIGWTPVEWTSIADIDIMPGYRLLPFKEAYDLFEWVPWDSLRKTCFPFMSDFFWNYVAIQINGQHLVFVEKDEEWVCTRYDNLLSFVETLIDEYEHNFFINNETKLLDWDMGMSFRIGRRHNPNSTFYFE